MFDFSYGSTFSWDKLLSNFVNLLGAETRYDITEKIDLGSLESAHDQKCQSHRLSVPSS